MADDGDQTLDEYNNALDNMDANPGTNEEDAIVTSTVMDTAAALGITEPPSAKTQSLLDQHPEIWPDYEESVFKKLALRGSNTTPPFLTLYERTKVLSLRASQLAHGSPPFINVTSNLTNVFDVAKAELEAKRLPYILKRPLPNGEYEFWRLADLILL